MARQQYRSLYPRTDQPGLRLTHQLCALFARITGCFTGSPAGRGEDPRHYRLAGFPLAQAADCTLLFSIDSPSFFPSVVSGMGLAECLLAMLVVRHGREAVSKIESAERYLIESGAYVIPVSPDK